MEGTSLAALIGLIVPLLVAVAVNTKTSSAVKGGLAAIVSILIGATTVFLGDSAQLEQYATAIVAVIVVAQSSYAMFWKPLGVSSWILEHLGNTS